MPHHKDCWIKNKGCTTVGCLGTMKSSDCGPVTSTEIQNDDLSSTQATASVYCTRCGAPIQSGDAFCGHCGSPVNAQPTAPGTYSQTITSLYAASTNDLQQNNNYGGNTQNSGNEYNQTSSDNPSSSTNDIDRLIGTKTEYYLRKFNKFKGQGEKASWNWCAFFVAPYWFIYRKMYGYGAGILGVLRRHRDGSSVLTRKHPRCYDGSVGGVLMPRTAREKSGSGIYHVNLFQDRFKSEPIKNDAHFLAVLRYIYQNPVKANICREPGKYRWSSYRGLGTDVPPVDRDRLLEYLPLEQLRAFVETQTEDRFLDLEPNLRITDQEAAEMAKGIIKTKRLSGIHMLPPAEQAAGIKSLHEKGCSI
ncbi:MAG: DUF2628 domain-containing protein, partial [Clostridiaceae bacterium]|nr:DUF2628 domain-containing protein [Clostridiaceae bacterium]